MIVTRQLRGTEAYDPYALHPTWLILIGGAISFFVYKAAPKKRRAGLATAAGIGSAAALYTTGWFTGRDPVMPEHT